MVLRRWESENRNLVLSNELMKVELQVGERSRKLTFRALALRQSEYYSDYSKMAANKLFFCLNA